MGSIGLGTSAGRGGFVFEPPFTDRADTAFEVDAKEDPAVVQSVVVGAIPAAGRAFSFEHIGAHGEEVVEGWLAGEHVFGGEGEEGSFVFFVVDARLLGLWDVDDVEVAVVEGGAVEELLVLELDGVHFLEDVGEGEASASYGVFSGVHFGEVLVARFGGGKGEKGVATQNDSEGKKGSGQEQPQEQGASWGERFLLH